MGRSVTVTGRGEARAPFDIATLALGATARATTPTDATTRAGYALGQVRDAVLARGVVPSDLVTGAVSLEPVHDPWPTVVAFQASFSLTVRTATLAEVGSLLVAAVDAGGDAVRVDGVTFQHRDRSELERRAHAAAYGDARRKAEQYAGLAGQALGEVRRIRADDAENHTAVRLMAASSPAGDVPIDPGDGAVAAAVTVTWALGPAV